MTFRGGAEVGHGGAKTDPKAGLPHCPTTSPCKTWGRVVGRMGRISLRGGEVGQNGKGNMTSNTPVPVTVRGETFPSISACAPRHFGISPQAVWDALERGSTDGIGLGRNWWRKKA